MKYVIIGNSVAGTFAAKEIRDNDKEGDIDIFSEEEVSFYSRLRLPEVIAGKSTLDQITLFKEDWYRTNNINLHLNAQVKVIDDDNNALIVEDSSKIYFDKLLIATGSKPRKLKIKDENIKIYYLHIRF